MLRFESVSKRFGSKTAVDAVTFSIEPGESLALLGPNGAGKTTLLRVLMDFTRASSGIIRVGEQDSRNPLARTSLGFLPEHLRLPPHLSGRQYLVRNAALAGLEKDKLETRIGVLLDKVGMSSSASQKLGTYSKGMRQRIGLAAAMLGEPKLLVLDEPISGLDPLGIREIRSVLEDLHRHGTSLLISSHLLSEAEKMCDSAAIMHLGRLLAKDRMDKLVGEGESLEDVFVRLIGETKGAS